MFSFPQETLIKILTEDPDFKDVGVSLVSYGMPRDGFKLSVDVPHWVSGFGGKYEMRHTNVPTGTMIAVGNLEDLDVNDFDKLKSQLRDIDIYPAGMSGDFTGADVGLLQEWFFDRSRLDNDVNPQTPIAHAKALTPSGLGMSKYAELVDYLVFNMNLFKDPDAPGLYVPPGPSERAQLVKGILDGLSKTARYTRLDDPALAFQFKGVVTIEGANEKSIQFNLHDPSKIIVLRQHKNGLYDLSPLDQAMIGRSYVTKDGEPLLDRGSIDISEIASKAFAIENEGKPSIAMPFFVQKKAQAPIAG